MNFPAVGIVVYMTAVEANPTLDLIDAKRIWASVLVQAALDLRGGGYEYDANERRQLQYSAKLWIDNLDNHGVGSFIWTCQALDINPDRLRQKLLEEAKPQAQAPLRIDTAAEFVVINEEVSGEVSAAYPSPVLRQNCAA